MVVLLGMFLATWSLLPICLAFPDIHKHMTDSQLQSIFNVDHIDAVPSYELIQLIHHGTDQHHHSIRRRSVNNLYEVNSKESHHVKKDLSKTPYFSELKLQSEQSAANSISDHSYSDKIKNLDLSQVKEHNVSFSAFGEVLNLTLKPTDGLFKDGPNSLRMWTASSDPNATQGVQYEELYHDADSNSEEHVGEVFQDEKNMAALLMRRQLETGDLIMEGSIGHEIVIKPVPHELSPIEGKAHHIVYKRDVAALDHLSDFAYMEPDQLETHYRVKRTPSPTSSDEQHSRKKRRASFTSSSSSRRKRAAPYMIYPEILVIVDYDGYRLHGGDNVQVKRYFVSFWNGVDLRYRLLKGPRIRISIAGIIISRGRDATPYLERNRVGRDAIDSAAALTDMGKYLFRERRLPVYDIAVAITKYDMCRRRKGGRCTKGTAGFAYVGGACVVNKRLEKVNSVAIIEDTGGFSGIIVAAHEVGHLLGAVHDGSPPPSYLGGPGAERCRWEDGYIMSDLRHTERGFRWSPCTIQSFHHFLNGDTASCLHNAPHEDAALGRALPGTLLSLDAQCRRDRGTYACFKDERVCAQLFCFDAQTGYCVAYRPAAEGSSCGNGSHCLDGRCVAVNSNVIPDYHYRSGYNSPPEDDEQTSSYDDVELSSTTTTSTTTQTPAPTPTKHSEHNNIESFDQFLHLDRNPSTSTTKQPTTNNFSFLKRKTTLPPINTTTTTTSSDIVDGTKQLYRKPFDYYLNLFHKKDKNRTNPHYSSSTTSAPTTTTATPSAPSSPSSILISYDSDETDDGDSNNNNEPHPSTTQRNYIFGGRSTTRTSFFEAYFKKLATSTRNPYNFDNFGDFFKPKSDSNIHDKTPPADTTNYLGDNTNNLPVNASTRSSGTD